MGVQGPLTNHNYDYRTSAILDQRENIGSMSTMPCVRSRQADYGHVPIPPIQVQPRNAESRHTSASIG